jgi:uncharacterized protein YfdQ (DUF2303 family)
MTNEITMQDTPELFNIAEHLMNQAAAALKPEAVGHAHFVNVPPGYSHKDVTELVRKAAPAPHRKQGVIELASVDSFITFCKEQQREATGYIYANPDTRTMTAVFNDNRSADAGWRDHQAKFQAKFTPEFQRWLENNGHNKAKGQTDFAEFIEDNLADITEPAAQQLLEVASTIQAKSDINFSSAKRLHDGQVQLGYTETINASAGANGALQIPKEFALGLRIFKNGEGYKLRARLKYRLGNGQVKFWYELDRPERAVEDAFAGYVDAVSKQSGYVVLLGNA